MPDLSLTVQRKHIFISYKRGAEPDEVLAQEVYQKLSQYCKVFIDLTIRVGTDWARQIEEELGRCDFLIVFLSEHSVQSEMVKAEIETSRRLAESRNGKPVILPVRIGFQEPLQYPLSAYLNHIQYAIWENETDTRRLQEELLQVVLGGDLPENQLLPADDKTSTKDFNDIPAPMHSAQPIRLEMPEGTIDPQSAFYIVRNSDEIALNAIRQQGVTITIKGPRQMGKSSLLIRTMESAMRVGKRIVFLDYQLIERESLSSADLFYRRFCDLVTEELEMENRVTEYWDSPTGNGQRCTRYFSRYLLKELDCPLVLAMDEVESLFDTSFRSDFFSMLRSWHNSRANPGTQIWKRLDLVLVTSTEPYQLIKNLNQSPFNVGEVIELSDFTNVQTADLIQRHGIALSLKDEGRLTTLLSGHPYLTRRALYLIGSHRLSVDDLFTTATDDRGPFGDHLRYHLFRIFDKPELLAGLREIFQKGTCRDEHIFFRLRGAGLIKRDRQIVYPRCKLYTDFFREHLDV